MNNPMSTLLTDLCKGNPGCLNMLVRLLNDEPNDFLEAAEMMIQYRIYGSKAYMLWNDACGRDNDEFMKVVRAINDRTLPIWVVEEHLSSGYCQPFDLRKDGRYGTGAHL